MPYTAFNAHDMSTEVLKQITKELTKVAAETPAPQWARTQGIAFPTHDVMARGLSCETCHQEHQGVGFSMNKISNEKYGYSQVVNLDSFDGHHTNSVNDQ